MNKELELKTKEWMQLERKTFEQRQIAERYYDDHLMKLIESDYVERNKVLVKERVECLVVSVGTSYEPIVLNVSLLKPDRLFFLYTEKSSGTLDKIVDYCKLKATEYEKKQINEIDPIDVYKEIKEAYLLWKRPLKMYVDFTGGTKAMSAACALASSMIDVKMLYVASDDYLVDFRKPNPGSEKLVYVEDPISVFGDLEVEKAEELFTQYNFAGALEKYAVLKENIPNPVKRQELNFKYLLAKAYGDWDALDFIGASIGMRELCRQLDRDGRSYAEHPLVKGINLISKQSENLEKLAQIPDMIRQRKQRDVLREKELIVPLMFTMFMNARTRERQEKYDMATLLTYRLLEMIEQRRLSLYNLYVSDMHYDAMRINVKRKPELKELSTAEKITWLKTEVYEIKKGLFGPNTSDYLPNPVSLLDGFIILLALGDPVMDMEDGNRMNVLHRMRSVVYLRNNSIFAHGLGPVSKVDYEKFRDFVLMMFWRFCKVEKINAGDEYKVFDWIM